MKNGAEPVEGWLVNGAWGVLKMAPGATNGETGKVCWNWAPGWLNGMGEVPGAVAGGAVDDGVPLACGAASGGGSAAWVPQPKAPAASSAQSEALTRSIPIKSSIQAATSDYPGGVGP